MVMVIYKCFRGTHGGDVSQSVVAVAVLRRVGGKKVPRITVIMAKVVLKGGRITATEESSVLIRHWLIQFS